MPPTLKDVCKLAGTSDATASMILNGRKGNRFTPETRDRVMKAARELGYRPQRAAQMLRTGKSNNIAVLLNDLSNPFFGRYASLIQRKLLGHGYTAIPLETQADARRENELLNWLPQRAVDGAIDLQGMLHVVSDTFDEVAPRVPLAIRCATAPPKQLKAHIIDVQYAHGMRLLAEHLAETGRKRPGLVVVERHVPGHIKGGRDSAWTQDIRSAFETAGMPIAPEHWCGPGTESDLHEWYEGTRAFLEAHREIDCLVAHNAALLPPVLQGAIDAGRTISADLAVACFDDPPEMAYLAGGVTTVREPVERIASWLVEGLVHRIKRRAKAPMRESAAPELVVRRSTTAGAGKRARQHV